MEPIKITVPLEVTLVPTVAKASEIDAEEIGCAILKSVDERRYTLGLAYPANRPDVGRAMDGFRDVAGPEAVEKAAWEFLAKADVGLFHVGEGGKGRVVESYVYRGPDWQVDDTVIKAGDWLVGTVWDEPAWVAIKKGRVNGYSPQGGGRRIPLSPERAAQLRSQ